jgi:hypothetical protein
MSMLTQTLQSMGCRWLLAIIALTLGDTAQGQSWDDMLRPHVSRPAFDGMLAPLALDAQQASAAGAAFDAYLAQFTREAAAVKVQVDALSSGGAGGPGAWQRLNCEWWEARLRLETSLEQSVSAAIGDDAEREGWRKAMRDSRRTRELHVLRLVNRQRHACDVLTMVWNLSLSDAERARVTEPAEAAARNLDAMIRDWQREHIRLSRQAWGEDAAENDPVRAQAIQQARFDASTQWVERMTALTKACRDIAPTLAAELEPANRRALQDAVERNVYPEAFQPCPAQLALEALRLMDDLAPEQRAACEALYADYATKRDAIRRQILDLVSRLEGEDSPLKREIVALWQSLERGEIDREEYHRRHDELQSQHPANPLLEKRHNLAIETARRMRSVLGEQTLARLPLSLRIALTAW